MKGRKGFRKAGKVLKMQERFQKFRKGFKNAGNVLKMQERFYKVVGKVLKLWERLYHREKVGKVSKFQERLFNDNFKAGNGEERKGKGKLSVPPLPSAWCQLIFDTCGSFLPTCNRLLPRLLSQKSEFNNLKA